MQAAIAGQQQRHDQLVKLCFEGNYEEVQKLLEVSDGPEINAVDPSNGWSALHICCQAGHDRCANLLLTHRADVNKTTNDGATPLYLSCQRGHDRCVQVLLQHKYIQ